MVSNASDYLPEPERPVITVSVLRGIATVMSLRLCSRAPRTTRKSPDIALEPTQSQATGSMLRGMRRSLGGAHDRQSVERPARSSTSRSRPRCPGTAAAADHCREPAPLHRRTHPGRAALYALVRRSEERRVGKE